MTHDISFSDIVVACGKGRVVVLVTPTLPSPPLSRLAGRDIWFKAENLRRT